MQCPVCNIDLVLTERQGIEVDYCPKCRGVWLDRGELDKLIERGASMTRLDGSGPSRYRHDEGPYDDDDDDDDQRRGYDRVHRGRRERRGSFLGGLFDFD
jgi:Zn-finger nucleic acid-binding protein